MPPAEHAGSSAACPCDHDFRLPALDGSSYKAAGDTAARAGEWRAAADAYSAALGCLAAGGSDPHFHGALLANRCLVQLQLGEAAAALADARLAVRVRPRWGKAHLRLGQALQANDAPAEAATAFQRASELNPALEAAAASAMAAAERDASLSRCTLVLQARAGPLYDAAVRLQALALGRLSTQLIATGGSNGTVRLWCSITGRQLQLLSGHSDAVTRLAWSPCGALLASASLDGSLRLWQMMQGRADPSGTSAHSTPAGGSGSKGASATGELLLLALTGGPVVVDGGRPSCLSFCPDSSLLAVGTSEGAVWLLGTGTAACAEGGIPAAEGFGCSGSGHAEPAALWRRQKLSGHGSLVSAVSFSPCGHMLASASGDGLCKLWDAASGAEVAEIAADSGPVNHCAFLSLPGPPGLLSPHRVSGASRVDPSVGPHTGSQRPASLLATCHINQQRQEGRVLLWDAVGRKHGWVDGKICGPVTSLDDFQGKVVAAQGWCSDQADTEATNATAANSQGCCDCSGGATGSDAGGRNSAGALLAVACADGTVKAFDLLAIAGLMGSAIVNGSKAAMRVSAPLWELVLQGSPGRGGGDMPAWSAAAIHHAAHERNRLALSPDGRQLAVVGPDLRLLLLDAESGEQLAALAGHTASVRALRWLAPGRLLSAAEDGTARVWNVGLRL